MLTHTHTHARTHTHTQTKFYDIVIVVEFNIIYSKCFDLGLHQVKTRQTHLRQ